MPTKIIRQPEHVAALADMLRDRKMPITVTWTQGGIKVWRAEQAFAAMVYRYCHAVWRPNPRRRAGRMQTGNWRSYPAGRE
jgi:hypothetical protein